MAVASQPLFGDEGWLDRVIGMVAPGWAARRAHARAVLHAYRGALQAAGHYDGGRKSRRTDGRRQPATGPNAAILGDLASLRNAARDYVRNNAFAARAVSVIATNTVGTGIIGQASGTRALQDAWRAWANTPTCDADGLTTFYGLQHLAMRAIAESGEVLIRRRRRRVADGLDVPLQLQVIEPDYLDQRKDGGLSDGGWITQGVEFNAIGQRVAYWLYRQHPGETNRSNLAGASVRIPASQVLHLYRVDRAGQVRGVPWAAPVMLRLRDFMDYEDAQLMRQKIAACFVGFVRRPGGAAAGPLSGARATTDRSGRRNETFVPGTFQYLEPGDEIEFSSPPSVDGYDAYTRRQLIAIAAGWGVPYEALTNDLSNVNFSSGRMGWLEFGRNVDAWRWHMLEPGLNVIWSWFLEACDLTAIGTRGASVAWTAPRREMISPKDEVGPMIELARAGLSSVPELIRERGDDPDAVLEQASEWAEKVRAKGLQFTSDARVKPAGAQPDTAGAANGQA